MRKNLLILVLILLSCGAVSAQESQIREHIQFLTDPALRGRKAGTAEEQKVASYVFDCFREYGLTLFTPTAQGQDFSIVLGQDTLQSRNIVGLVNGYDSLLRNNYIVVGANMDHLGVNRVLVDGKPVEQVFPGANSNASGLACMLELAQMVSETSFLFRRSIVFVAFGAKEQTMAGSWYFVNKAFPYMPNVEMMINLNMLGRNGRKNVFSYSTISPNSDVELLIQRMEEEYSMMPPVKLLQTILPSDFLAFYEKEIPVVLFTTGRYPEYNTVNDRKELLDMDAMEFHTHYIYNFLKELANADDPQDGNSYRMTEEVYEEGVYSFADVDQPPTFFKGDAQKFLSEWVYSYLRYPMAAIENGIQGTVYVEFIIDLSGNLKNARVVQGVSPELDKEALRVVSASPKWKPGKLAGTKVKVKYTVPVEFRLKKR